VPDANNSHTRIVAEIIYEVLAETERTYENRGGDIPTREDYVSDVIRVLQDQLDSGFWREAGSPLTRRPVWDDVPEPIMGNVAYIVDQQGATFAFPSEGDADDGYDAERRRGAVDLTRFTVIIPRQGMTWYEVADYACSHGPDDPELADALRGHRAG
jgi:hypothetical protein